MLRDEYVSTACHAGVSRCLPEATAAVRDNQDHPAPRPRLRPPVSRVQRQQRDRYQRYQAKTARPIPLVVIAPDA
jgi:hypothetical protein